MLLRADFAFASLRSKSVFFLFARSKIFRSSKKKFLEREREIIIARISNARMSALSLASNAFTHVKPNVSSRGRLNRARCAASVARLESHGVASKRNDSFSANTQFVRKSSSVTGCFICSNFTGKSVDVYVVVIGVLSALLKKKQQQQHFCDAIVLASVQRGERLRRRRGSRHRTS